MLLLLLSLLLPPSSPLPNIVVILADDLGWNDLSWHNPRVISPNLASLAAGGITLEQHYSQPVCSPTRGALLTGRYPIHIGLHEGVIGPLEPHGLNTNSSTLADLLLAQGYKTHAVGKWHLGFCNSQFLPTSRGFQHHYGYWLGAQDYYQHTRTVGDDVGYDFRDDLEVDRSAEGEYSTELYGRRAADIIRAHDQSNPLFLYLPFQAVHGPLQAPQEYIDLYADIEDEHRRTYLAMVTAMDAAVGEVVNSLKESNMYEDTLILFLSDNGGPVQKGANNWPLRGSKGSLWEGGTRTLAFLHQADVLAPRVEQGLVHVTDWLPTLLEAAGSVPPSGLDGWSHWAALSQPGQPWARTSLLYNINYRPNHPDEPPTAALRQGHWKYLWSVYGFDGWQPAPEDNQAVETRNQTREVQALRFEDGMKAQGYTSPHHLNQLFDLSSDPLEMVNVAELHPWRVAEMQEALVELADTILEVDESLNTDDPAGHPSNFGGVWSAGWC